MIEAKFSDFENICIIENIVYDIIKLAVNKNDDLSLFVNEFVDNCINDVIEKINIENLDTLPSIKEYDKIIKKNKKKK